MQWKLYYIDDKTEGKSVDYDEAGNITDEDIYKDGECIEKCEKYD
jgi:antitoxin component YwqK of YwqJK toxin-antitoxin module